MKWNLVFLVLATQATIALAALAAPPGRMEIQTRLEIHHDADGSHLEGTLTNVGTLTILKAEIQLLNGGRHRLPGSITPGQTAKIKEPLSSDLLAPTWPGKYILGVQIALQDPTGRPYWFPIAIQSEWKRNSRNQLELAQSLQVDRAATELEVDVFNHSQIKTEIDNRFNRPLDLDISVLSTPKLKLKPNIESRIHLQPGERKTLLLDVTNFSGNAGSNYSGFLFYSQVAGDHHDADAIRVRVHVRRFPEASTLSSMLILFFFGFIAMGRFVTQKESMSEPHPK